MNPLVRDWLRRAERMTFTGLFVLAGWFGFVTVLGHADAPQRAPYMRMTFQTVPGEPNVAPANEITDWMPR
jgi:hypothetical protein